MKRLRSVWEQVSGGWGCDVTSRFRQDLQEENHAEMPVAGCRVVHKFSVPFAFVYSFFFRSVICRSCFCALPSYPPSIFAFLLYVFAQSSLRKAATSCVMFFRLYGTLGFYRAEFCEILHCGGGVLKFVDTFCPWLTWDNGTQHGR